MKKFFLIIPIKLKYKFSASTSSPVPILNVQERVELRKLEQMLPVSPKNCDPADVVLRAASYIDQLVATVQARVKNGTLPMGKHFFS